jgi:hypothetical protein
MNVKDLYILYPKYQYLTRKIEYIIILNHQYKVHQYDHLMNQVHIHVYDDEMVS